MITDRDKIIVSSNDSIRYTWRKLDTSGLRVVAVLGVDGKFYGIVTDGDIRRGLLGDIELDDPIERVTNTNPLVISSGHSKKQIIEIMERENVLAIPVVDRDELIGVEILHDLLSVRKIDNPIFIMAGGFGTRLRPLTDNCPKPMLKVGTKPMLEILMGSFIRAGFHNFFISTHYMPEVIEAYFGDGKSLGVSIKYIYEETPLGTGGALGLLADDFSCLPMLVINGDVLTTADFRSILDTHNNSNSDATMCIREYEYKIPYGVVNSNLGKVTSMEEKPTKYFSVNTGIYVLSPSLIKSIKRGTCIDLPSVIEKRMLEGNDVRLYQLREYWLDIGRIDDFNRAQADIHTLGLL